MGTINWLFRDDDDDYVTGKIIYLSDVTIKLGRFLLRYEVRELVQCIYFSGRRDNVDVILAVVYQGFVIFIKDFLH